MVAEFKIITATEYARLGETDERDELIDGVVIVSPEATPRHQLISLRLPMVLQPIADQRRLGQWLNPVYLQLSEFNVFAPDLLFYRKGDLPDLDVAFVQTMPAIVVEILSPSTRSRDHMQKKIRYAERKISEYWIVDPVRRSIEINHLTDSKAYSSFEARDGRIPIGLFEGAVLDIPYVFGDSEFPST